MQGIIDGFCSRLHIRAGIAACRVCMRMVDRMDIWEKDIIHLLLCQLHHMPVDQFDRIAGFTLCVLLGELDGFFIGYMGHHYIVTQISEKLICKGEKLEHDKDHRDTDRFPVRIDRCVISTHGKLSCHLVKLFVFADFFRHILFFYFF